MMNPLLLMLALLIQAPAHAIDVTDVAQLAKLFTGEFDSYEQARMEERADIPFADRHTEVYLIHRPIEAPAFGTHVFYVEEYRDGDPENVIRQRVVTFEGDSTENAVRMKQFFLRNEKDVRGAHNDPSRRAALVPDQSFLLPGCDVFWRKEGESYVGAMKDGACVFALKPDHPKRVVIYQVSVSDLQYQRTDRSVFVDSGKVAGGRADDFPTVHKRVVGAP